MKKNIFLTMTIICIIILYTFNCSVPKSSSDPSGGGTVATPVPEIVVKINATEYQSDNPTVYNFGSTTITTGSVEATFTINNTGSADLDITSVTLSDTTNYTLNTTGMSTTIAASGNTTFKITFNPKSTGTKNATVTITNNDGDEGNFVLNLTGEGTATPVPEIVVKINATEYQSNNPTAYNFGSTTITTGSVEATFTINNVGSADLNITEITLSDTTNYTLNTAGMSTTIAGSSSTTFKVTFNPKTTGTKDAIVTITNNDSNEGSFVVNITGEGIESISNIKIVDSDGDVGGHTSVAFEDTNVYISYYDVTNNSIKFAKSTDGGATWPTSNIKTIDTITDAYYGYTSIAVDGDNVYISYYDGTGKDLKFAKSTDGGATWPISNIRTVDSSGSVGQYNSMAVNGNDVYIIYIDLTSEINYDFLKLAKSTDGGITWPSSNIKAVYTDVHYNGFSPSIAVDGDNVYICYYSYSDNDLMFTKSADGGSTWFTINQLVDRNGDVGDYSSIAVDGDNVYISYYDGTGKDLKFAKSTDGGVTWLPANTKIKTVDSNDSVGLYSSIGVDGSNIYISYYDNTNNDLKFAKSTDMGATWLSSNIKTIDSIDNVGLYSSIAVDGDNIYISYFDITNGDLKFAKSTDGGETW